MRTNRKAALMAAVAATSLMGAKLAHAGNFVWNGLGADASWSTGANWVGGTAPSASTDTIAFDDTGLTAPSLSNVVDSGLATQTFTSLTYSQTDATKTYTTDVASGLTLNVIGTNVTTATVSFLVRPGTASTTTLAHSANVVIQGAGGALTVSGGIGVDAGGQFVVSGKPTATSSTEPESRAILDLSGLNSFTYYRWIGGGHSALSNFYVGGGNLNTADKGAYSGKVILPDTSFIHANRIIVGSNFDGGIIGGLAITPVSELILGQTNNFNTGTQAIGLAGNVLVGADSATKISSGALKFRSGLTNPTLNIGDLNNNTDVGDINRNGFEVGSSRGASTASRAFGVFDMTSASGGAEGTVNAYIQGTTRIGQASTGAGGAAGMVSIDKGFIDSTGNFTIGRTSNLANSQVIQGVINVGVKGSASDAGQGVFTTTGQIFVGLRNAVSTGTNIGVVNLANSGAITADRIFVGANESANDAGGTGTSVGIVNLGGGVLTTNQVLGGDTTEVGTHNVRIVNFNGGKLVAKTGTTLGSTFMERLTAAYVHAGGATIDSNNQNITINQAILAPTGQGLSSIDVTNGGGGYRAAPIVNISGGGGTGATAVAQINSAGVVTGITVTNPGTGYTSAPTIDLIANGGTTYAATLVPYGGTAATTSATLAANVGGGITKVGAGTLSFTGSNTYSGATTIEAGTLRLGVDAQSPVATGAGADVKNGKLALAYSGVSNVDTVRGLLASGKIHSSIATAQVGLGYSDDGASAVTVTRAVFGDANLDGVVNTSDFDALANAFNSSSGTWVTGDFNYDGTVNALDFNTLVSNFGATLPPPGLGSLVPEPMSIGLIGIGALSLVRRRKQSGK